MDTIILSPNAKGIKARGINDTLKDMCDVDVSHAMISKITEGVMDEVVVLKNRPLDQVYPVVFLDCIDGKVRENERVFNKSIYLTSADNTKGLKNFQNCG